MSSLLLRRIARSLGAGPAFIVFVCIAIGCENEYPADLKYPLRSEPLVTDQIKAIPKHLDKPGELSLILSGLEDETDRRGVLNPQELEPEKKKELDALLDQIFGTPLRPQVNAADVSGFEADVKEAVAGARKALLLDDERLARGSELYRIQCLHCHGLTGNGRGPTAPWVNPHPRDYRPGIFKFTSSSQPDKVRKPRRVDLLRTLREGIEGTSMPSFGLLPEADLEALVSYVIHLSMRGQLEFNVTKDMLSPDLKDSDLTERANDILKASVQNWMQAENLVIRPDANLPTGDERARSIQNGHRLFRETTTAGCISCHKDYGRQADYFYDSWGTIGRPTDLTTGVYRGGRRPIDFFWRIHSGVNGSNMPAFANALKPQEIWDLVNFVQILPYPQMRKKYGVEID